MRTIQTSKAEEPLYEFAFGFAGSQRAYDEAVERLAFEAATKCTHSYDPLSYLDAVSASIVHPDAKSLIVRQFLKGACDLINEELGLRLDVEMTRYGGGYGRGEYGRIDPHMSRAEILNRVAAVLTDGCGTVPDFAVDFEGRYLLEWCLDCIEVADAGDADHYPEGDCADALADRLRDSGLVLDCLRSALIPGELQRRLSDPDRVASDLKYRARAAY